MDENNKNLILATALSFAVILVWFLLFPPPEEPAQVADATTVTQSVTEAGTGEIALPSVTAEAGQVAAPTETTETAEAPRIVIATDRIEGSISLTGGRIDDLRLKDYRETLDEGADIVTFLSPMGSDNAYYALYGWAAGFYPDEEFEKQVRLAGRLSDPDAA